VVSPALTNSRIKEEFASQNTRRPESQSNKSRRSMDLRGRISIVRFERLEGFQSGVTWQDNITRVTWTHDRCANLNLCFFVDPICLIGT
jgi:hypothetical protein